MNINCLLCKLANTSIETQQNCKNINKTQSHHLNFFCFNRVHSYRYCVYRYCAIIIIMSKMLHKLLKKVRQFFLNAYQIFIKHMNGKLKCSFLKWYRICSSHIFCQSWSPLSRTEESHKLNVPKSPLWVLNKANNPISIVYVQH